LANPIGSQADDVRSAVRRIMGSLKVNAQASTKDPDKVIHVEILKTVCCMSVLPNYYRYQQYNMGRVAKVKKGELDPDACKKELHKYGTKTTTKKDKRPDSSAPAKDPFAYMRRAATAPVQPSPDAGAEVTTTATTATTATGGDAVPDSAAPANDTGPASPSVGAKRGAEAVKDADDADPDAKRHAASS